MNNKKQNIDIAVLQNILNENEIIRYKEFYKNNLINIKNRSYIIDELNTISLEFNKLKPSNAYSFDVNRDKLYEQTKEFLIKNFNKNILNIYEKKLERPILKNEYVRSENKWWLNLLGILTQTFEELKEEYKQELNYKKNFINFLSDCIDTYGLHSNILQRSSLNYKRFNLIIYHYYRTGEKQRDSKILMNYEEFDREFYKLYLNKKPIKMKGKLIPFDDIYEVKITTTLLLDDEIQLFALKNNFSWNQNNKDVYSFIECCIDETETYHPNPFEDNPQYNKLNKLHTEETKIWLLQYPDSSKLYNSALEKFEKNIYERNLLDDLRLSLELLLKTVLENNKPIEKQIPYIGKYLKKRGSAKETINMLNTILDYYSKYQNNNIKHDEKIEKNDVSLIFNFTIHIFRFVLGK